MLEDSNSILKGLTNCQKNNKIAGRSIELISIGFWCSTYGDFIDNVMDYDLGWPHPRAIVDFNWERERRSEILNYLKSGISIQAYNGWSNCRFSCAEEYLGTEDFTDGMWLWPEGLSHYVEVHHVRLPEAFIIHMAKNHFKVPNLHLDEYEKKQTFTKYWVQWCAENTPPPSAETSSLTIKQATKVANKFSTETYNADICQTFGRWRLLETLGNKHYLDYAPPLSQLSLGIRLLRNRSLQKTDVIDIEHANLITSQYDTIAIVVVVHNN